MRIAAIAMAVVILSGIRDIAHAAQVVSPPLLNQKCAGSSCHDLDTFFCEFLNVGKSDIGDVVIQLVDGSTGVPVVELGPLTLVPGNERLIAWESNLRTAYCRAIGSVNSKKVYVTICNAVAADKACQTAVSTLK